MITAVNTASLNNIYITPTEHCGQVVNSPPLYSGDPGFDTWPQQLAALIEVFCGFLQSLQVNAG
jgi:hypothetical protein